MEKASGAEIHGLFLALLPGRRLARVTVDPFGNYVVQKLVDTLSHEHRLLVGEHLLGQVLALSTNTYGCRVVQKLVDVALSEDAVDCQELGRAIGRELETHVLELVEDQNGNHVVQKAIERLTDVEFIHREIRGHVVRLGLHCYGCRVIQRLLERVHAEAQAAVDEGEASAGAGPDGERRHWGQALVEEVMTKMWRLSADQFGNYVVQHVLVYGSNLQRDAVVRAVAERVVEFSCHKYASNVAERALVVASESGRALIIAALLKPPRGTAGEPAILALTRDRYANYVVQRCVQVSTGSQKAEVVRILRSQLSNLKKVVYGKHILAAIDKHIVTR
jgi:pumilio RNA-binding family